MVSKRIPIHGRVSASPATDVKPIVYQTRLFQNSPNPFNPETEVRFELATPSRVSVSIFDAAGRRVRTLIDDARPAGVQPDGRFLPASGRTRAGRASAPLHRQYDFSNRPVREDRPMRVGRLFERQFAPNHRSQHA